MCRAEVALFLLIEITSMNLSLILKLIKFSFTLLFDHITVVRNSQFSTLVQAAVVNLFVLNLVCFISVCFLYTRNGQVGEHVLLLWFLALVLAGCCCQLVCFEQCTTSRQL